jgi:hypothetical protein
MEGHHLKVEGYLKGKEDPKLHTQASMLKVTPKVSLKIVETTGTTPKNASLFKLHPMTEEVLSKKKTIVNDLSKTQSTSLKSTLLNLNHKTISPSNTFKQSKTLYRP